MSVTGAIIAGVGAASSIGSAAISSNAAGNAADTQANASEYAANLQKQEADQALQFQKDQWSTQQQNLAPWLSAGKGALGELTSLTSTPGAGLLTPWSSTFQAPTNITEANDPGFQFRLAQGEGALQNSAAAKGNLLSGNTLSALTKFGQDYSSNEYQNVYNRALGQYLNSYNIFENNQANTYNRLAGIAGTGQQAATTLGQEGQAAAQNVGNISLTTGAQQGQDIQNAAAARASGYVGSANAWSGALGNTSNNLMNYYLMSQMFNGGGGVTAAPTTGGWA